MRSSIARKLTTSPVCSGSAILLLKGRFKVSSGIVEWCRSSYGTDFENSEIASPVVGKPVLRL